ncbi:MAG: DNA-directed RNA polymerase subunit beta', partial [Chitinispirillales bacterium]|nr:DNA-directed RNA polymerase subunit beta' [Chitinispirillales bacterium]
IEIKAPDVILRNEMRMLQEAVDTLFDNGRRTSSVKGEGKRPLKSLSDLLKGKQGRFRQNLLGKRVDYSGRSVIVVGPELKIHQCGLPKLMALELFKPFVIQKLEEKGFVQTVKSAKKFVEKERPEVWDILEEVIKDHPVLLNRAPTLHRLGIQAFFPVLVEGKAIRLHPLVCSAFNADFDGDQMAVHVPLSFESQLECRFLMLSANNLLSPASGHPVMTPTQDIVLGIYYLTKLSPDRKGQGRMFSDADEVLHAIADNQLDIHAKIKVRVKGKLIETTPGRVVLGTIVPDEIPFEEINQGFNKRLVQRLVEQVYNKTGTKTTCKFLDDIKTLGYEYATKAGITFGADDLIVPEEKEEIIRKSKEVVEHIRKQHDRYIITEGERYNKLIDEWTRATNQIADKMYERLSDDKGGFNPVFIMMDSQARGSKDQIKQLAGMRGLMQKPQKKITGAVGEIIENPIISNFRDGLTVLEYFISTHGARKGLADTALKTADAGYLTRRLVDVVQDVVISKNDCNTSKGIFIKALKEGDDVIESLSSRLLGRVAQEDVYDKVTEELICEANKLINDTIAKRIESAGVEEVMIRSVLTCDSEFGVCQLCYGRNLATGKIVDIGEAVGIMAAQSIGEPGTQLTLRTFHIGGTASRLIAQSKEEAKIDGVIRLKDIEYEEHKTGRVVMNRVGEVIVVDADERERYRYNIPYGSFLKVSDEERVVKGQELYTWDPYNSVVLTPQSGVIRFKDLVEDVTFEELYDERTGATNRVVITHKERKLHPHIQVYNGEERVANLAMPVKAYLQVKDGDNVVRGDILAKMPRESSKSRDITGGLPRVAELFEARRPKDPAVISDVDGIVSIGDTERGNRKIIVRNEYSEAFEYLIPSSKHLRVHEGDRVKAGERLCDGAIDPHDILRILGENEVQEHMLNEIQSVYRLQGVTINDKHVEVIVSQMLRKVRIEDSGGTDFLEGDDVDRKELYRANERIVSEGGEPARFKPLLLGITKASLTTESFLSAASFQETTKVLSKAAVEGKTDTLSGLKENLIMGNLIPAGTGTRKYRKIKVKDLETDIAEVTEREISDDFIEF